LKNFGRKSRVTEMNTIQIKTTSGKLCPPTKKYRFGFRVHNTEISGSLKLDLTDQRSG